GFGPLPPRATLTEVGAVPAPEAVVERAPEPVAAAPAFEPAFADAAPSKFEPPAQPEPAVTTHTGFESQAFSLTPPPEREPTFMPQPASVVWTQPETAAVDEAPLFEETWEEVRPAPRIIRHEPVETDLIDEEAGPSGPFVLLGVIGLFAFGGAVAAFIKAKQLASPQPVILAWTLALLAFGCVTISVYFLLKRLGGVRD
ncbi:hypothetical protein, partial [Caulobacter sp. 17J65-9]|uniref:hypothetical protein n=1 Tax=Caulobacter sp. 17J65-9 TaxID=2709382 RepID=UPI0013CAA56A